MKLAGLDRYHVVDPLFEGLRVILAYRGEPYTPAWIQGVSGSAFRLAGICPCAPTCSAAMETAELARRLGYQVEAVAATDLTALLERLDDELAAGRPALIWNAFTTAEWDVVCGHERGQLFGRGSYLGLNGYAEAAVEHLLQDDACPPLGALFIGERVAEADVERLEIDALAEAVRHAHTPADRFVEELRAGSLPWRFREGLAAYDAWLRRFAAEPGRVPDAGDRYCAGVYAATRRCAGAFLREIAPRHPAARELLLDAASSFEVDAGCLSTLCHGLLGGWQGWQQPDESAAAKAVDLLRRAREAYAVGIERLAAATYRQPVEAPARPPGTAVRVPGVRPLSWGSGRDNTWCGALVEQLRGSPHPYAYADLMGYSGLAFRLRWSNDATRIHWCPSSAVGELPDEWRAVAELSGWTLPCEWHEAGGRDEIALLARLTAEIDAGRPVLVYSPTWSVCLAYGYEPGGLLDLADYDQADLPHRRPMAELGPLFGWRGEWGTPPPLAEALRASLRGAVANWRRVRHDGGIPEHDYWYGAAAYDAWIADLRGYDALSEESRAGLRELDPWVYAALLDARAAAVAFLSDQSVLFDGAARQAVERAAGLYQAVRRALEPLAPDRRPAGEAAWSAVHREAEAAVLEQARRLDEAAVGALEEAVRE